jgi:hypothetical protein
VSPVTEYFRFAGGRALRFERRSGAAFELSLRGGRAAPADANAAAQSEEKNASVQADFDANRPQEILVKTITSPNRQRILTVYQRLGDPDASYRLDMYAGDGSFCGASRPRR